MITPSPSLQRQEPYYGKAHATEAAKSRAVMNKEHSTGSEETSLQHCELPHTTAPEL